MALQEQRHLKRFDQLVAERRVRPTALQPVWNAAGFALGAVTALVSPEAAMAFTDAVETEIDRHYKRQLDELGDDDPELSADIAEFDYEGKCVGFATGCAGRDFPADTWVCAKDGKLVEAGK